MSTGSWAKRTPRQQFPITPANLVTSRALLSGRPATRPGPKAPLAKSRALTGKSATCRLASNPAGGRLRSAAARLWAAAPRHRRAIMLGCDTHKLTTTFLRTPALGHPPTSNRRQAELGISANGWASAAIGSPFCRTLFWQVPSVRRRPGAVENTQGVNEHQTAAGGIHRHPVCARHRKFPIGLGSALNGAIAFAANNAIHQRESGAEHAGANRQ